VLTLTYTLLDHGWAAATLSNGVETLTLEVSYISPALDDLVDATIALMLDGEEASFRWYTEPGRYQIVVQRQGIAIRMRVLELRFSGRWIEIFAAEGELLRLAIQVRSQLRQLRHTHGLEGYLASWRRDFPVAALRRLEDLIRDEKGRRPQRTAPPVDTNGDQG